MNAKDGGSVLVTGAAGQLGAVGRTVTELLLAHGHSVRAMVRREDDRSAALRVADAEVHDRKNDSMAEVTTQDSSHSDIMM